MRGGTPEGMRWETAGEGRLREKTVHGSRT